MLAFIGLSEIFLFCIGIYYLYILISHYSTLKSSTKFYNANIKNYIYSLVGVVAIILSFQIFWLTSFYKEHKNIDILIKIILLGFSIVNQMSIDEFDKEKRKHMKKKDIDIFSSKDRKWTFKLINKLFLLNIVLKFFYKNNKNY